MNEAIIIAINKVEEVVLESGNAGDLQYFIYHKKRFIKMAETVLIKCKPNSLILDIGSHYLHSSLLLHFLGFRVHSMDVENFWNIEFVKERAAKYDLYPIIENSLETLHSCAEKQDTYNLILFTEILEHITFNPINFWKKIYDVLKNNSIIYITTPNSLTLFNIARTLKRIFFLQGIGTDINSIFGNVTYGHHWKEYSTAEIKKYFTNLSDGFTIECEKYFYKSYTKNNSKNKLIAAFVKLNNLIPYFREEIEVVVHVNKNSTWKLIAPNY